MTVTTQELNTLFRHCKDIGMSATDRSINDTENHEGSVYIEQTIVIRPVITLSYTTCMRTWLNVTIDARLSGRS